MIGIEDHERYMRRAIEVARERNPARPFSGLIVDRDSGEILAEGINHVEDSPIFHGETDAIDRCARAHPGVDFSRTVLYATGEPCPMCRGAILWSGIPTVVLGSPAEFLRQTGWTDPDLRPEELELPAFSRRVEVIRGVLEEECNALFRSGPPDG
jgi:tRNA(adenine34) deaminase